MTPFQHQNLQILGHYHDQFSIVLGVCNLTDFAKSHIFSVFLGFTHRIPPHLIKGENMFLQVLVVCLSQCVSMDYFIYHCSFSIKWIFLIFKIVLRIIVLHQLVTTETCDPRTWRCSSQYDLDIYYFFLKFSLFCFTNSNFKKYMDQANMHLSGNLQFQFSL